MTEYIGSLKTKFDELATLNPIITDLKVLQERAEVDRVYQLLAGLDPSYEPIRSQIMMSSDPPSFSTISTLLEREETYRKLMNHETNDKTENSTFLTKNTKNYQNPSSDRRGRGALATTETCTHCKK
jgi:hypothetical protein